MVNIMNMLNMMHKNNFKRNLKNVVKIDYMQIKSD